MHQKFGTGRLGYARMLTPAGQGVNRNGCESLYVTDTTIEFQNVEYQIDIRALHRAILSDVSLRIHQGETIALLGRSGSGKTTMLKLINRLRYCTAGDLFVEGRRVQDWNPIQLRRRIGYVIQEVGLFPHLTIQENVSLVPALESWPAERSASRYAEVMQVVGLNLVEYANRYPRELSGGQRQRVGVARALA